MVSSEPWETPVPDNVTPIRRRRQERDEAIPVRGLGYLILAILAVWMLYEVTLPLLARGVR